MSSQNLSIDKKWAAVYADRILLEAETKPELKEKILRTRVPAGYEMVALAKAHHSVIV